MIDEAFHRRAAGRWSRIRSRPSVQRALALARKAMLVGVIAYLVYKLTQVGWGEVIDNLPVSPWFYLFFVLRFFALPLSEIPAYERVWGIRLWPHVTAFVRKRVYNFAVMGYSGEAFFTLWARRRLGLSDPVVLKGVKDNNILSAFASNLATVALIVALAAGDRLQPGLDALPGAVALFSLAFLSSFVLVAAVMAFGRRVLHVDRRTAVDLICIHSGRMVIVMALHAAMYAAALPTADYVAWFIFIALQLVLSRIPFLPNQDLVFLGAALSLASITGAPEAAIAGMLVAEAGLSQLFNFALFFATAHDAREAPIPGPGERAGRSASDACRAEGARGDGKT